MGHCILKQTGTKIETSGNWKVYKLCSTLRGAGCVFSPLAGGSAAKVADGSWTGC